MMDTTDHFRAAFRHCLRHSDFKSQKAVAEAAQIGESSLSEMLTKKSYGIKTQAKIAKIFGYDDVLDFLALGRRISEGQMPVRDDAEYHISIPLYASGKLAAGENGMIFDPYEEPASTLMIPRHEVFGRKNHHLAGLIVGGESMSPIIPKGSVVIVDPDDREFSNNKIYAVNYPQNGENIAAVKRVQKWKHGFVLLSSNPEYPPELSESDWRDLCVGRTIWVWKSLEDM